MSQLNSGLTSLNLVNSLSNINLSLQSLTNISSSQVTSESTRSAYLSLYAKHADVVKSVIKEAGRDPDTTYSAMMSGFASVEIDSGNNGTIGGGGFGDGGDTGGI